ncbi:hypothetical protein BGP_0583 [Beggiatoa sp. PS]|nr:hypothetical protein BGP_0583 [Beggiatoa sp. PS]
MLSSKKKNIYSIPSRNPLDLFIDEFYLGDHWAYLPHYKGAFAYDPILPNGGDIFWRKKTSDFPFRAVYHCFSTFPKKCQRPV